MRSSNFDKYPATRIDGKLIMGWETIVDKLQDEWGDSPVWAIDLYVGSYEEDFVEAFAATGREIVQTRSLMIGDEAVKELTDRFITDDVLFGYMSNIHLEEYFCEKKVEEARSRLADGGKYVVIGTAAARIAPSAPVAYADMARWEIQQRFRRHEVKALGIDNSAEGPSLQYKRGYFNDWNICDAYKDELFQLGRISFWIDHNCRACPKMITDAQFRQGLQRTVSRPFRVVPFFDPAPWGGQWMKEVCGLDPSVENYGWCFDCVPEENSLYFLAEGERFELPSQDVVLWHCRELLGHYVWSRFGRSFPIRFDFLDTMGGGNLSVQVHPTSEFAHRNFGLAYTQDESYYLLDAGDDAVVYLGLKEDVCPEEMIDDLRRAQRGEIMFDAERYVNKFHARKHDHYLIPNGTVHCSGHNSMVLEISSTPSIFTFKLWDWGRLGLDGKPRPINVERGSKVIQWERRTEFVKNELCNRFEVLKEEDGALEERTGLHRNEFIETRRHTFSRPVTLHTEGGVNVLNLCQGESALVESPTNAFEPFEVHYAETFIIPACIGEYTLTPGGNNKNNEPCMAIKASVRG